MIDALTHIWAWLSAVLGWFAWIGIGAVPALALLAVAWFVPALRSAAILAAVGWALFFTGMTIGYERKTNQDVAARTAQLETRLRLQDKILTDYEAMATRDEADIAKLRDMVAATPENKTACLPEDAAGRIGGVK